jgi:hypothetical protein
MGLFHDNVNQYIEESTARTLANYISSHSKAIKNSAVRRKESTSFRSSVRHAVL